MPDGWCGCVSLGVQGYPEGQPTRIKVVEDVEKLSEAEKRRCSTELGQYLATRNRAIRLPDLRGIGRLDSS